jgi:hypothetical protein
MLKRGFQSTASLWDSGGGGPSCYLSKYAIYTESLGLKLARPNLAANHSYLYVYFVYGRLSLAQIFQAVSLKGFLQVLDFSNTQNSTNDRTFAPI